MKSFLTNFLAFLPLLSFFSALTVDARLTTRQLSTGTHFKQVHKYQQNELTKRAPPKRFLAPAPHWITYTFSEYSQTQALPTGDQLAGYNVLVLSFWLTTGPSYKAAEFARLSQSTRDWIVNDYHAHGISLLVSAFGYGDNPTTDGKSPITVANDLAAYVKKYNLDGVDVDWEDFAALKPDTGKAEKWLIDFTKQLRVQLPVGQYIVAHAPIAPWFTTNSTRFPFGAYRTVHKEVGNVIDWYNIQFYNQGSDYIICPSLLTRSLAHNFFNTSLFEINKLSGVPLEKLVIGKPAAIEQSNNGFMDLGMLSNCLKQAKTSGWNGGVMLWQFPAANSTTIKQIRSLSWPV